MNIVRRDLKDMSTNWDEAEELIKKCLNVNPLKPTVAIWVQL